MSSIKIEVNGSEYSNFSSASVGLSIEAMSGEFAFEAVSTEREPLPIKLNDACSIIVDGEKVLTGFIEEISIGYDSKSHSISLSGRSKTCDIIDSSINSLEIKPPISLKGVIEKVVSHIGASIKVIDKTGLDNRFTPAMDLISPEVGENAFSFIEKLARKKQVLLTTDGEGNIVVTQSGDDLAPASLQSVLNGDENNIESASASYHSSDRFNKYVSKSQLNLVALNESGESSSEYIVSQKSVGVTDNGVRPSRQFVLQSESSSSDAELQKRSEWEANIRKSRSLVYTATVNGYGVGGKTWKPNQLTRIVDDFSGINAVMLVSTVDFSQEESGISTRLSFVEKNSYTLKINEPKEGDVLGYLTSEET